MGRSVFLPQKKAMSAMAETSGGALVPPVKQKKRPLVGPSPFSQRKNMIYEDKNITVLIKAMTPSPAQASQQAADRAAGTGAGAAKDKGEHKVGEIWSNGGNPPIFYTIKPDRKGRNRVSRATKADFEKAGVPYPGKAKKTKERVRPKLLSYEEILKEVETIFNPNTPVEMQRIENVTESLMKASRKTIDSIKKNYGVRASGSTKAAYAKKIAERIIKQKVDDGNIDPKNVEKPTPPTKDEIRQAQEQTEKKEGEGKEKTEEPIIVEEIKEALVEKIGEKQANDIAKVLEEALAQGTLQPTEEELQEVQEKIEAETGTTPSTEIPETEQPKAEEQATPEEATEETPAPEEKPIQIKEEFPPIQSADLEGMGMNDLRAFLDGQELELKQAIQENAKQEKLDKIQADIETIQGAITALEEAEKIPVSEDDILSEPEQVTPETQEGDVATGEGSGGTPSDTEKEEPTEAPTGPLTEEELSSVGITPDETTPTDEEVDAVLDSLEQQIADKRKQMIGMDAKTEEFEQAKAELEQLKSEYDQKLNEFFPKEEEEVQETQEDEETKKARTELSKLDAKIAEQEKLLAEAKTEQQQERAERALVDLRLEREELLSKIPQENKPQTEIREPQKVDVTEEIRELFPEQDVSKLSPQEMEEYMTEVEGFLQNHLKKAEAAEDESGDEEEANLYDIPEQELNRLVDDYNKIIDILENKPETPKKPVKTNIKERREQKKGKKKPTEIPSVIKEALEKYTQNQAKKNQEAVPSVAEPETPAVEPETPVEATATEQEAVSPVEEVVEPTSSEQPTEERPAEDVNEQKLKPKKVQHNLGELKSGEVGEDLLGSFQQETVPEHIPELRERLKEKYPNLTKEQFDDALWELVKKRGVYIGRHDYPASLTQEEKDNLLFDGEDYFMSAALHPDIVSNLEKSPAEQNVDFSNFDPDKEVAKIKESAKQGKLQEALVGLSNLTDNERSQILQSLGLDPNTDNYVQALLGYDWGGEGKQTQQSETETTPSEENKPTEQKTKESNTKRIIKTSLTERRSAKQKEDVAGHVEEFNKVLGSINEGTVTNSTIDEFAAGVNKLTKPKLEAFLNQIGITGRIKTKTEGIRKLKEFMNARLEAFGKAEETKKDDTSAEKLSEDKVQGDTPEIEPVTEETAQEQIAENAPEISPTEEQQETTPSTVQEEQQEETVSPENVTEPGQKEDGELPTKENVTRESLSQLLRTDRNKFYDFVYNLDGELNEQQKAEMLNKLGFQGNADDFMRSFYDFADQEEKRAKEEEIQNLPPLNSEEKQKMQKILDDALVAVNNREDPFTQARKLGNEFQETKDRQRILKELGYPASEFETEMNFYDHVSDYLKERRDPNIKEKTNEEKDADYFRKELQKYNVSLNDIENLEFEEFANNIIEKNRTADRSTIEQLWNNTQEYLAKKYEKDTGGSLYNHYKEQIQGYNKNPKSIDYDSLQGYGFKPTKQQQKKDYIKVSGRGVIKSKKVMDFFDKYDQAFKEASLKSISLKSISEPRTKSDMNLLRSVLTYSSTPEIIQEIANHFGINETDPKKIIDIIKESVVYELNGGKTAIDKLYENDKLQKDITYLRSKKEELTKGISFSDIMKLEEDMTSTRSTIRQLIENITSIQNSKSKAKATLARLEGYQKELAELQEKNSENQKVYQEKLSVYREGKEKISQEIHSILAGRLESKKTLVVDTPKIKGSEKFRKRVEKDGVLPALQWLNGIVSSENLDNLSVNFDELKPGEDKFGIGVGRPCYAQGGVHATENTIFTTSSYAKSSVAIHEFGHALEFNVPGVAEAVHQFYKYRTQGEEARTLNELSNSDHFLEDEKAIADRFFDVTGSDSGYYIGRVASKNFSEIISMGLETLYTDPAGMAERDPEFTAFILGILDGSLRMKDLPDE